MYEYKESWENCYFIGRNLQLPTPLSPASNFFSYLNFEILTEKLFLRWLYDIRPVIWFYCIVRHNWYHCSPKHPSHDFTLPFMYIIARVWYLPYPATNECFTVFAALFCYPDKAYLIMFWPSQITGRCTAFQQQTTTKHTV